MQVRKRYQNGGGVPGGDPKRQAEQLAFAQLLAEVAAEKQRKAEMLDQGAIDPMLTYPNLSPYPTAQQVELSPELREERGRANPAVLAADYLTPVGDLMQGLGGLGELVKGNYGTGSAMLAASLAGAYVPGPQPKIKNIRGVEVTKRDPSKHRIADMFVEDNAGIGKELGAIDKSGMSVEGEDMFEPFISADAARVADNKEKLKRLKGMENPNDGQRLEIERLEGQNQKLPQQLRDASAEEVRRTMALATNEMLDAVPIGGKVGSSSLSTDSYAIILKKWAKGQLSAKKFDAGSGENYGFLNRMGRKYKNSPEVEQWHLSRYDGNEEIVGYDEFGGSFNSMYAPAQQMEFEEFVQVDPAAKKAFQAGNKKQAENLYEKYTIQADNDLGISYFGSTASEARLSREEAQELANKFNMRMRELAQERPTKQERMLKRGDNQSKAKLSDDLGIPPARIVEDYMAPGYYAIEYPQIPFHRNFEYGGKFKIKKKRRPGMQVKR
jgi:hypothetical protein